MAFNQFSATTGVYSDSGFAVDELNQYATYFFSCFKGLDGKLYVCGDESNNNVSTGAVAMNIFGFRELTFDYTSGIKKWGAVNQGTFCLMNNGDLWYVGKNGNRQIADGTTTNVVVPRIIQSGIVDIEFNKQVSNTIDYIMTYTKDSEGNWFGMGYNNYGRCGDGSQANQILEPRPIVMPDGLPPTKIYSLGTTYGATFALAEDDKVYATGYNGYGQLGVGNTTTNGIWQEVLGFNASDVKDIQGGYGYYDTSAKSQSSTVFLLKNGDVYTCGDNDWGQLGLGLPASSTINIPTQVAVSNVESIQCQGGGPMSVLCTFADKQSFTVWGYNSYGQLGVGSTSQLYSPETRFFPYKKIFTNVGGCHTYSYQSRMFLLANDGKLYSCGQGGNYALGNGSTANVTQFQPVPFYEGDKIKDLIITQANSGGASHVLILLTDGSVYACGYNGQYVMPMTMNQVHTLAERYLVKVN